MLDAAIIPMPATTANSAFVVGRRPIRRRSTSCEAPVVNATSAANNPPTSGRVMRTFSSSCKNDGERANTHPTTMNVAAPMATGAAKADRISGGTWRTTTCGEVATTCGRVSGIRTRAPVSSDARTMSST